MKISCQSCQSKYNVADEKVRGKIVKIRCRKCGATIVVNGTEEAAAANGSGAAASTAAAPSPAAQAPALSAGVDAAQWHVNVGENDQRTMTLAELVDAYNTSVVTQDTFLWTDGMEDWRPLAEVEPVVAALHAHAAQEAAASTAGSGYGGGEAVSTSAPEAAYASSAAAPYEAPAAAYTAPAAAYAAPAATYTAPAATYTAPIAAQAAVAAPVAEPKRAAVMRREARGRDLFAAGGVSEEVQTSAPVVPQRMSAEADDSSGKLTGQRNENSVLFSLAVLTKDADDRAPNEPIASGSREDSGLIDLKALAAKAESMRPAAMADGGVFAPPIGFAPPLGAPLAGTLGPALGGDIPQRSKLPLFIGAGAGVALLLVLGIVIGVKIAGSDNAAAAGAMPSIPIPTMTSPEPASAAASSEAAPSAAPSASVALSKPKGGAARPQGGAAKPSNGASPGSTGGASTGAATGATAPAAPKKSGGDCGCNGDLMCLMKCSTGH